MSNDSHSKLILFLSYVYSRPVKDQIIWIYCLSKIKKIDSQSLPLYELLYKTKSHINIVKSIIKIGNQYLNSINYDYSFSIEKELLIINKVKVQSKPKRPKKTKAELKKEQLNKHQSSIIEIIDYLNQSAGTEFDYDTNIYNNNIIDRLNEGFTIENFRYVIELKCYSWLGNPKMQQHLNPKTLFGEKMEIYVKENIVIKQTKQQKNNSALEQARSENLFSSNPITDESE